MELQIIKIPHVVYTWSWFPVWKLKFDIHVQILQCPCSWQDFAHVKSYYISRIQVKVLTTLPFLFHYFVVSKDQIFQNVKSSISRDLNFSHKSIFKCRLWIIRNNTIWQCELLISMFSNFMFPGYIFNTWIYIKVNKWILYQLIFFRKFALSDETLKNEKWQCGQKKEKWQCRQSFDLNSTFVLGNAVLIADYSHVPCTFSWILYR